MFPPHKNSYLQARVSSLDPRIINQSVTQAQEKLLSAFDLIPSFFRLTSEQPAIPIDNVDVTKRPLAFGRLALPKLRRELHDDDETVVIAALTSIADLVHDPEKAFEAINLKIPDRLADLLIDPLVPIRERTCIVLTILSELQQGKEAIVSNWILLENLKICMEDQSIAVREQVAKCLQNIAEVWMTADVLVEYDFIQAILDQLQRQTDEIIEIYLIILKDLMYGCGKCVALKNDAFRLLVNKFLKNENPSNVVCKALDCLMVLTSTPEGKRFAIEKKLLHILNRLIHYQFWDTELCTSAVSVIMFCTIKTRAKHEAAEIKSLPKRLVKMAAAYNTPNLQLYALKALTNICEHPTVRKEVLQKYLKDLENIQVVKDNVEHKNFLLKTISWCPEKVSGIEE